MRLAMQSNQSAAGLKALKPAANGRCLVCKSSPYHFHLLYRSKYICPCWRGWLGVKNQLSIYPVSKVHAGSLRVSVIHLTLTWTTGTLACVRDHSYACVHTRGLGTHTASQQNIFDSEKLRFFSCATDGIRTSVLWSWVRRSTNWATPPQVISNGDPQKGP